MRGVAAVNYRAMSGSSLISSGRLDPSLFATHRFGLGDTMAAYDTFANAADTGALKVVLCGPHSTSRPTQIVGVTAAV